MRWRTGLVKDWLALNVGAMLIAFYAVIMLVNEILGGVGNMPWFGTDNLNGWISEMSGGQFDGLSLETIFGVMFAPIAWLIGVNGNETLRVGQLIGIKIFATEFFAYVKLAGMKEAGLSADLFFFPLLPVRFCQLHVNWHTDRWDRSACPRQTLGSCRPRGKSLDRRNLGKPFVRLHSRHVLLVIASSPTRIGFGCLTFCGFPVSISFRV